MYNRKMSILSLCHTGKQIGPSILLDITTNILSWREFEYEEHQSSHDE